jgi:hypothetical protein
MRRPVIYISDILAWADAFHARWRRWPCRDDGPVAGMIDLTWMGVNQALIKGHRGLLGGSSLPKLLLEHRGRRHRGQLPHYRVLQILRWADSHHRRTGCWPSCYSGRIAEAPQETWRNVDKALRNAYRGLFGRSSLALLLKKHRGVRFNTGRPPLHPRQILAWADAYYSRTGAWPTTRSGPIPEAPGKTWAGIQETMRAGRRGLARIGTLAQLLARYRGVRNQKDLPPLSRKRIVTWAKAHHARTGRWPRHTTGPIPGSAGETWNTVQNALRLGRRGFPPRGSLYQLLRPLRRKNV